VAATLAAQCALIVLASLAGGSLPEWIRLTHRRMQFAMSFVGGLMLGIALLQLLPHAATQLGSPREAGQATLLGLLLMFFLLRMFHFHEHEPLELPHGTGEPACDHDHDHDHAGDYHVASAQAAGGAHRLSWGGVAFGLALHTLIDGMALAAAVRADMRLESKWLAGAGVFAAIVLHKPLDAVSITSLMTAGGWSRRARITINAVFAAMCPLGALLFVLGVQQFAGIEGQIVGSMLGLSAGVFLCISMSDLLPEIEFHAHDRILLTVSLVAGVVAAVCLSLLEPGAMPDRSLPPFHL
jgi:zinc and cadmium transporter